MICNRHDLQNFKMIFIEFNGIKQKLAKFVCNNGLLSRGDCPGLKSLTEKTHRRKRSATRTRGPAGCGTVARNGRSKKRLQNVEGSAYRASYNIDL